MGKAKEFFEMTRHERRGSIMVLVLIAVLLAATCVWRCNREASPSVPAVDLLQFEKEADTTTLTYPKSPQKTPAATGRKRRHAPSKPTKPAPAPRRLDPVPQI